MFQSKDSGFTLFGTRIPPISHSHALPLPSKPFLDCSSEVTKEEGEGTRIQGSSKVDQSSALRYGENQSATMASEGQTNSSPKDDQAESSCTEQERSFKKPDKIIPCPRCNSLDTKFCYFNNYNVHQPRHFCKNCQRYWTAGGTMRNVPVGAGRRKNKHLASQYRQILVSSDGIPTARIESPNTANHPLVSCRQSENSFKTGNGTVLKFGPDASLCESRETVLNIRDQKSCVDIQGLVSFVKNGEEPSSCVSSMTTACSNPESELPSKIMPESVDFPGSHNEFYTPHPIHCYPATPWILPCNPGWNGVASTAATAQHPSKQVQFFPTPMMAVPGFCPPSFPLQFIPAPYWGCMPLWSSTGTGMTSLTRSAGAGGLSPSSSTSNSCCSGNGSPTLGKHGRDTNFMDEKKPAEKCIVVPKTLRVDDPDEASRSPIWVSLGIKHGQTDSMRKDTIFRAFESKAADSKGHVLDGTLVLEANPAALSRSQTFNEST